VPEGDSVAGHARRLGPLLVGEAVVGVRGTAPSLRRWSGEILDAQVTGIRTVGKHLTIDLDTGYSIRVHLGMSGRWAVLDRGREPHGSARLVLTTASHHVVCHSAPTVEVGRTALIEQKLAELGPDLLGEFDEAEYLRRARKLPDLAISAVVLDQRVLAGIGNVYKSEILFLQRIHPDTPVSSLSDDDLLALADGSRRLLRANVGRRRSTTGSSAPGGESWVYGRSGKPCRRCGSAIAAEERDGRITYWCPTCQPQTRPR
jgi:endonuclease VIII